MTTLEARGSYAHLSRPAGKRSLTLAYVTLAGLPVLGVAVLLLGGGWSQPAATTGPLPDVSGSTTISTFTFVAQVLLVLLATRVCGAVFQRIGQARVVGEMTAGILLGPSLLGWLAPSLSAAVFPEGGLFYVNALSQLGLIVFMFLVGLSVDPAELRERGHAALLVSHVSIALPLFLGAALAVFLYPRLSSPAVGFTGFALFIGAAMSITAFPVLARILSEHNMLRSPAGTLATACAAVDDITGWSLLAFVVVIVRGNTSGTPPWLTFCGGAAFAAVMIWLVRPLLRRILPACDPPSDRTVAIAVGFALASAAVTELLGIHLLFGAFLAGAIMPRRPELVDWLVQRLESITLIVLLPLFFAVTGLRTSIGLVNGAEMWGYTGLIVLTAIAGKLGGSTIAARCAGLTWRDGALLGALMNTRGLMELVALNIGLEAGVISPAVYSMMVIMALVTTMMTVPLVRACTRG